MCDPQALKGESGRLKEKGKPMSDTPRTDAAVLDYHGMVMEENGCVPAEFARGLERELAAQRDLFKREVENAYREGHKDAGGFPTSLDFKHSRAHRIVQGEQV